MSDDLGRLARQLRQREQDGTVETDKVPPMEPLPPPPEYDTTLRVEPPEPAPEPPTVESYDPHKVVGYTMLIGWSLVLSLVWLPWSLLVSMAVGIALLIARKSQSRA